MAEQDKQLIPINWVNQINIQVPPVPSRAHKGTITSIRNSINVHAYLNDKGELWIAATGLSTILRTDVQSARFFIETLGSSDKIEYEGEIFVSGHQVAGQIFKSIEESGLKTRGVYLSFSEECLKAARDSDKAKVLRGEYQEFMEEQLSKLKKKRIKLFKITIDELTGESLEKKSAEFSHIRSKAKFRDQALDTENGLVVNKSTHRIITDSAAITEEHLFYLCQEKEWSLEWYPPYLEYLRSLEESPSDLLSEEE
ncbi:hypothetical protein [Paenibacillus sp. LK1]|uniref:hypothetical protein n=1 Tax=Paenibacillus sp. LK1 TaxID=2053014 RepID=UPI000C197D58|nr:hypothetical protein [Paenibacillus sp. LK1]PIH55811.1 hypothetical protein CS562_29935 [Paenibacillus sp. LK1]